MIYELAKLIDAETIPDQRCRNTNMSVAEQDRRHITNVIRNSEPIEVLLLIPTQEEVEALTVSVNTS